MLYLQTIYHILLGIVLCSSIWSCGIVTLSKIIKAPVGAHYIYAYPLGLVIFSLVAVGGLTLPYGSTFFGLFTVFVHFMAGQSLLKKHDIGQYLKPYFLPALILLCAGQVFSYTAGLKWHGPSQHLSSLVFGDTVSYVAFMHFFQYSLFPVYDLLIEGQKFGLESSGVTLVGANLLNLGLADGFLFLATSVQTTLMISILICCFVICPSFFKSKIFGCWRAILLSLMCTGSVLSPTWLIASPPVSLSIPLAFVAYVLMQENKDGVLKML